MMEQIANNNNIRKKKNLNKWIGVGGGVANLFENKMESYTYNIPLK